MAYTKRPPGFNKRAALSKIAVCLTESSATASGVCRHFKSGFRRKVPSPVQGASTNTRSILPRKRLMRSSLSWAIATGWILDKPLRAKRGFKASKRWAEVSKAYKRPVLRMDAPSAKVLPPAPAQKSATISPRLASTNSAKSCEPSSCTSIKPFSNSASLLRLGLAFMRNPQGEKGVGTTAMPWATKSACTSARLASSVLTRTSKPAVCCKLSTSGQNSSPNCVCKASANQGGKLCL